MKSTITCRWVWIWLFLGIGALLYPKPAGAFSGPVFDPDQVEYVQIKATVMSVDLDHSRVVIAEKWFDVTEFKIGQEIRKTTLLDAAGNEVALTAFKPQQRVAVTGIRLAKDKFVADVLQMRAPEKAGSNIYRPILKAPSIAPLVR